MCFRGNLLLTTATTIASHTFLFHDIDDDAHDGGESDQDKLEVYSATATS